MRTRPSSGSHLSPSSTISIGLCDCFIPMKENDSYSGRNESECDPIKCPPLFSVLWAKRLQATSTGGSMSESKEEGNGMEMAWTWWQGMFTLQGLQVTVCTWALRL